MLAVDPSAPGRPRSDSFPSQDIRSCSRSPQKSQAPLPSPSTGLPPALASAASVVALELQVEQRFHHLEQRLNSQFSELLASIRASQAPTVAAQLASQPSPVSAPPQPPSHPNLLPTSWPEHLVKLRNPGSRVSREASRSTGLTLAGGQLSVVDDSSEARTFAFVKAIPSIAALAQVWLVYVAIRARHTANLELNAALLAHLEQLIEFDHLYLWRAVADYHLAVCHQCFGTATISEWASYDPQVAGRVLFQYQKSAHNLSRQEPNLGSSPSQPPPQRSSRPCQRPIAGTASELVQTCRRFNVSHLQPLQGCSPSAVLPRLHQDHQRGGQEGGLILLIFDEADFPASVGSLQLRVWSRFLAFYPDQAFADQLCGVLRHGAKLGVSDRAPETN
ncbi:hypothetical protein NDA18_003031 [Ustilago nuda]|nr:hypothetical protein NDA18_003031 [Ustilago nuda]